VAKGCPDQPGKNSACPERKRKEKDFVIKGKTENRRVRSLAEAKTFAASGTFHPENPTPRRLRARAKPIRQS